MAIAIRGSNNHDYNSDDDDGDNNDIVLAREAGIMTVLGVVAFGAKDGTKIDDDTTVAQKGAKVVGDNVYYK